MDIMIKVVIGMLFNGIILIKIMLICKKFLKE